MTTTPATPLATQSSTATSTPAAGHRDDGEIDRAGRRRPRAGSTARPGSRGASGLTGTTVPRKRLEEVVEDLGADRAALRGSPRRRPRPSARRGAASRRMRPPRSGPPRAPRRPASGVMSRTTFSIPLRSGAPRFANPQFAKDVEHPRGSAAEDVGLEASDAPVARDLGEPLEQARADALSLQRVLDGEGGLGALGIVGRPEVLGDRDDLASRVSRRGRTGSRSPRGRIARRLLRRGGAARRNGSRGYRGRAARRTRAERGRRRGESVSGAGWIPSAGRRPAPREPDTRLPRRVTDENQVRLPFVFDAIAS